MSPSERPGRRRDRHGRGVRGPLAAARVPLAQTRADAFDEVVEHAIHHLEDRWASQLAQVEFVVEDVPVPGDEISDDDIDSGGVPLARIIRRPGSAPQIVVYRRPLELRAADLADLADLAHEVVVEAVARFLGVDPDTVDPGYADES
ncbi:MAG TPA: metallopeptidase family protein [Mycobacteriales bacterium]|nr:metallopeptidase family protein [Mycobacteriales bacterium]